MSASNSSTQIVARFLRSHHYNETLEAFIQEAGLSEDAGSLEPGAWTIEQILEEKQQFDTTVKYEKQGGHGDLRWTTPAPLIPHEPQLEVKSNVLCVSGDILSNTISAAAADRSFRRVSALPPFDIDTTVMNIGDSPILSTVYVPGGYLLTAAMSGHLSLRIGSTYALIDKCRHHNKYAVQVVSFLDGQNWYIATAGWDQKIHIYSPDVTRLETTDFTSADADKPALSGYLGEPVHSITLLSNPESLLFARHPDTHEVYLIVSRRDSTHLQYFRVQHQSRNKVVIRETERQNLAPHSNAWVAFTPCSLTACPTDPTLIATATSHLPHMKLIVARLLFPNSRRQSNSESQHETQAAMARSELAMQDREDAAIKFQVTTMAPQTAYSTPQVVWRPNGSGLFVNGDDGVIRGIETLTGKVVCLLKQHEIGSKVRTLWAGLLKNEGSETTKEVLVSGGFDKKMVVWTSEN